MMAYDVQNEYDTIGGVRYWRDGKETDEEPGETAFYSYLEQPAIWIVMQSTGLTDKNDKEIFEGDIIRQTIDPSAWNAKHFSITKSQKRHGTIRWDNENAILCVQFEPSLAMHPCYECLRLCDSDAEVIGNIYEHPELVK